MYNEIKSLSKKQNTNLIIAKIFFFILIITIIVEPFYSESTKLMFQLVMSIIVLIFSIISIVQENKLKKQVNKYIIDNGFSDKECKKISWTIFTKTPWSLLKKSYSETDYKNKLKEFYENEKK